MVRLLSFLLVVGLAFCAVALPAHPELVTDIEQVIRNTVTAVQGMDKDINALSSPPQMPQMMRVQMDGVAILKILMDATSRLHGHASISDSDAAQLISAASPLQPEIRQVLRDIVNKKPIIAQFLNGLAESKAGLIAIHNASRAYLVGLGVLVQGSAKAFVNGLIMDFDRDFNIAIAALS